ncbi:autotransporter outer membrane beta-barrel domain-containing protein [Pseudomonas solani]|uniref:autotransporter outer membrane beta-barrel domain-containing protein n=1 Tax=Pseudomonas solani TaxID=2731552 RepID=UPI003C2D81CD
MHLLNLASLLAPRLPFRHAPLAHALCGSLALASLVPLTAHAASGGNGGSASGSCCTHITPGGAGASTPGAAGNDGPDGVTDNLWGSAGGGGGGGASGGGLGGTGGTGNIGSNGGTAGSGGNGGNGGADGATGSSVPTVTTVGANGGNGQVGQNNASYAGGGGGGGAGGAGARISGAATATTNATLTGGNGGNGGKGGSGTLGSSGVQAGGAGAGGDGGTGLVFSGTALTVDGTITGGNGGNGGAGGDSYDPLYGPNQGNGGAGGNSGKGGTALEFSGTALTINGNLQGGIAGTPGAGGNGLLDLGGVTVGSNGQPGGTATGGTGLSADVSNASILVNGSVRGGGINGVGIQLTGADNHLVIAGTASRGTVTGRAVEINGNGNNLELRAGYAITGAVRATGSNNTLTLGGSTDASFDSSRLGTGYIGFSALEKSGTSTWELTGTSSFSGPITLSGGTLRGSVASLGSGTIINNATLEVVADTDSTLANTLSGTGDLIKLGLGKLVLEGTQASSSTLVSAGSLIVGGSAGSSTRLTSDVEVASGATLGGHGTVIGDIDLANGATLAPGSSIGTLHVTGNVTLSSGSVLEIEANPDGTSDQLIATGTVDLGNATLSILGGAGTWAASTSYSLIQAGSLAGSTFGNVTSDLAFLTPTVSYTTTGVGLTLARNDVSFVSMAHTDNQRAVAGSLGSGVSGRLATAVTGLATDQTGAAFDSLSGELHASTRSALFDDSRYVREAITERLQQGATVLHRDADSGLTFWMKNYGSWSETDGDDNVADLDRQSRGSFIGADLPLNDTWRAGLAVGHGTSDLDVDARRSKADVGSTSLAAYLAGQWDALRLRLGAAHSWNDISSKRDVQVGSLNETLKADYDATTTQVFGELGYALQLQALRLEPYAGLAHVEVERDSFRERGGDAALQGDSDRDGIDYASLGLRAQAPLGTLAGRPLALDSGLAWQHAFGLPSDNSRQRLEGFERFSVEGVPVAQNSALLRVGLSWQLAPQASLDLGYAGQFGDGSRDQGVRLGVAVAF